MGVSKNSGTPKWMVKIRENPIKMDDLGGKRTPIFGNTHIYIYIIYVYIYIYIQFQKHADVLRVLGLQD